MRSLLEARNIILPRGSINLDQETFILEPSGNFVSVEDLRQTVLPAPGTNQVVYLGDIADVTRGYVDPPARIVRASGEPALCLAVSMREGGNLVHLGEQVRQLVTKLPTLYPHGMDFGVAYFELHSVQRKVDAFVDSVLQSIASVLFVMLLFLGLRTGAVVATLIPATLLIALPPGCFSSRA